MVEGMRESPERGRGIARLRGYAVPAVLIALAGILWADPWRFVSPVPLATPAPAWATATSPVRSPALRPEIRIGAYRYRCGECHSLFPSPVETDRPLTQHREIRLEHGINNRCFNCHLREDRDAFADYRGGPIAYDKPQLLCAKCHGPVYRDWTHGVHGRTNGSWDSSRGPVRHLRCIQCHDPHAPAFEAMRPAPGPRTLRMGEPPAGGHEEEGVRNPLRIYGREAPAGESVPPPGGAQSH